MGKTKRRVDNSKKDDAEIKREEKILEQLQLSPRLPTHSGGHFHDNEKQRGRKDRKNERARLRKMEKELKNG